MTKLNMTAASAIRLATSGDDIRFTEHDNGDISVYQRGRLAFRYIDSTFSLTVPGQADCMLTTRQFWKLANAATSRRIQNGAPALSQMLPVGRRSTDA